MWSQDQHIHSLNTSKISPKLSANCRTKRVVVMSRELNISSATLIPTKALSLLCLISVWWKLQTSFHAVRHNFSAKWRNTRFGHRKYYKDICHVKFKSPHYTTPTSGFEIYNTDSLGRNGRKIWSWKRTLTLSWNRG